MKTLKENILGVTAKYKTEFQAKKEGDNLIFEFVANESSLVSYSDKYNSEIWRSNVCEVFIDVGEENKYWEIEVAPNGTIFLAEITNIDGVFSGQLIDTCFIDAKVEAKSNCYAVKIIAPIKALKINDLNEVKINAYRIEMEGENQYLMSLNPTLCGTFHKPNSFIKLLEVLDE